MVKSQNKIYVETTYFNKRRKTNQMIILDKKKKTLNYISLIDKRKISKNKKTAFLLASTGINLGVN